MLYFIDRFLNKNSEISKQQNDQCENICQKYFELWIHLKFERMMPFAFQDRQNARPWYIRLKKFMYLYTEYLYMNGYEVYLNQKSLSKDEVLHLIKQDSFSFISEFSRRRNLLNDEFLDNLSICINSTMIHPKIEPHRCLFSNTDNSKFFTYIFENVQQIQDKMTKGLQKKIQIQKHKHTNYQYFQKYYQDINEIYIKSNSDNNLQKLDKCPIYDKLIFDKNTVLDNKDIYKQINGCKNTFIHIIQKKNFRISNNIKSKKRTLNLEDLENLSKKNELNKNHVNTPNNNHVVNESNNKPIVRKFKTNNILLFSIPVIFLCIIFGYNYFN